MIQTVTGAIDKKDLGIALPHEHILIDMTKCVDITGNENKFFREKITNKNRFRVYSDPYAILDNALIDNDKIATKELELFKSFGGNTIVDCTPDEIGRNPIKLKKLSQKTGVNIVMGCGHYYNKTHSEKTKNSSIKDFAEEMRKDLTVGVNGTGIKAGLIGEIGTSAVISESERKVLHAAGIVSGELDKAVHIHTDLYTENGYEIVKVLKEEGARENRICIDHIDVLIRPEYIYKLLDLGVYIEFDNFGKEFYVNKERRFAYDLERVKILKEIIDKGYEKQVFITNDICLKTMLATYGGNGYAHVLNAVKFMLLEEGVSEKTFNRIMTENVREFLD